MKSPVENRDPKIYCQFHEDVGHDTKDCRSLKRALDGLASKGNLKNYLQKNTHGPGSSHDANVRLKRYLSTYFHSKDLGALKYFLGIEVARGTKGLFISQRKYALDILSEEGMIGCKPIDTPMEQNYCLAQAKGAPFYYPDQYRRLVGQLVYFSITRPELSYFVHTLSQIFSASQVAHWDAALRVLRYIKGSSGQGTLMQPMSTCRSLSSYFIFLGKSHVSWKTKKQLTLSQRRLSIVRWL
ncbi:uncharacterized mitochondrial protein AtMg00810-like [Spinacia oleracea]|uniref:Uncharacterized mitochondrial protein AtMg00810-like n=1 Tax=Spinacia oleracea TaxID=3562 RepID=A0ABM3R8E2_SPIOL|nr:uncharacterized mitochondrial protein AtMg00810-like [Spinacia oleracea]